jgi:hypothetical protein
MLTWQIRSYINTEHNSRYAHRLSYRSAIILRSSVFWQQVVFSDTYRRFGRMTRKNTLNKWRYRRRWRQYISLECRYASTRIYGVTFENSHTKCCRPRGCIFYPELEAILASTQLICYEAPLVRMSQPRHYYNRLHLTPECSDSRNNKYTTMQQCRGTRASVGIAVLYFVDKIHQVVS